eukprot:scaffold36340_cov189-Skeletonema_dohrnii-CCMP3373.AAC.1
MQEHHQIAREGKPGAYAKGALPHEHEATGHEQGLQRSTKATRLRGQNEAMQGATHPGQAFQGWCVPGVGGDVTVEY